MIKPDHRCKERIRNALTVCSALDEQLRVMKEGIAAWIKP